MLLELARLMQEFASFFALFNYITMRAILSALTALALTLVMGPMVIERLSRLKAGGQPIRSDGPATHFGKAGTPTMGGALILLTITLATLLWGDLRNRYVWVLLAVLISFGSIGWLDDWIKIVKRDSQGLSPGTSMRGVMCGLLAACSCSTRPMSRPRQPSLFHCSRSGIRWPGFVVIATSGSSVSPTRST